MPRYQSQLRLSVFQQIQMLPHQRLCNARQVPLPDLGHHPLRTLNHLLLPIKSISSSTITKLHLLHQSILTSSFRPFLLMPWLKGPMSLGLGGAAATLSLEHHMGVLLAAALAECIVLNRAPKPNTRNLPVMYQSCEGTALLATGRLISQGPPSVYGHYPLRYYI